MNASCVHHTLHDAALCRECNPHQLTEGEFRAVRKAGFDPRRVGAMPARIIAELEKLVVADEAAQVGDPDESY